MILIIDDKPETFISLQKIFQTNGFSVDGVSSFEEALDQVLVKRYTTLLIDMQMVKISEKEVVEALRRHSQLNDIPTIFLITEPLDQGCNSEEFNDDKIEYIFKPIKEDILLLKVKALKKIHELDLKLLQIQQKLHEEIEIKDQAKAELHNRIHYLRSILETIPQIAFKADGDGNITFVNNRWYEYSSSMEVFPEQCTGTEAILTKWQQCIDRKVPLDYEVSIKNLETGIYRYHLLRIVPIIENNIVIKWVGTFTDIEEQKQIEHKKDEFLSIASHELKTPLTSMKGYVQLLARHVKSINNDLVTTCVTNAQNQVSKLEYLVSDLLDASKINNGKLQMNYADFDLEQLIQNTIATIEFTYPSSNVDIVRVGDILDLQVPGDVIRVEQVLINVLSNAIKYSPGRDKVFVSTQLKDGEVVIEVEDFGIGIPAERQKFIFSKFYKIEDTVVGFQGLGIGLYISAEIIKQHKGTYGLKSDLGRGTKVYFSLPLN